MFRNTASTNPKNAILLLMSVLIVVGLIFVYNSSTIYSYNNFGSPYYLLLNQFSWVIISFVFFVTIQKISFKLLSRLSFFLYILGIISLFILAFSSLLNIDTSFSESIYGAHRWLTVNPEPLPEIPLLGRLGFQPSEFMKLVFCLFIPQLLVSTSKRETDKGTFIKVIFYIALAGFLILLQPDLKSTLILLLIGFCILFVSGLAKKYFIYILFFSIPFIILLIVLSPYRMQRVIAFLGHSESSSSYHVRQINIALGSGGITGLGFGQSRQKNEYLPEVMGDSIFAIIGEELGFFGVSILISIMFALIFYLYKAVLYVKDFEHQLLVTGILVWYGTQNFFNLGSIAGVIPLTGVPLPFISYGGSSLLFLVCAFALAYKVLSEDK